MSAPLSPPMAEMMTGAPRLERGPSAEALKLARMNGGATGVTLYGPHVGWAGDTLLGHIPDAEAFARSYAAEHPDRRVVGPAGAWAMPAGLTRITKAEYDLVFAQYEVEEERKASSLPSPTERA